MTTWRKECHHNVLIIYNVLIGLNDDEISFHLSVSQQSRHGAVVSRSVTGRRSYITLKCPKDHVFANVKFRLEDNRVNTNYNKCLVNSLVAQKRCRWHRRCKINTKAKTLNCSASAIQLSNLKCVPKGQLFTWMSEIFRLHELTRKIFPHRKL